MLQQILASYCLKIEDKIQNSIDMLGAKTGLRDACQYALKNGGRRFRPALVLLISEAINPQADVLDAALAIEYFHTASLIADDLPCMDNEETRRNSPCVHKVFGESTALLATYALIAAGYDAIRRNAKNPSILAIALENATQNTGIFGATGGQFYDLYPSLIDEPFLRTVISMKTGALFEISFVFGWIFAGGSLALLPLVKKASQHFGMAFQIIDDFEDLAKDAEKERAINYPGLVGEEKAFSILVEEFTAFRNLLEELQLKSPELKALVSAMEKIIYSEISIAISSS